MKNKKNTEEIIVKVQKPLFSSDAYPVFLVYNEDNSIMQELPMRSQKETKQLNRYMRKGECGEMSEGMKNYFYAKCERRGLILTGLAPMQNW